LTDILSEINSDKIVGYVCIKIMASLIERDFVSLDLGGHDKNQRYKETT
jgi:hypothetical protein